MNNGEEMFSVKCFKYAGRYCDLPSRLPEGSHLHTWTGMVVLFYVFSEWGRLSKFSARPSSSCHELVLNEFPFASGQLGEGPELRLSYHN